MNKKYQCYLDFEEVSGGAIITEYEADATIVSVAEDDNIVHALGNILYNEITEGAGVVKAKVMIIIEGL